MTSGLKNIIQVTNATPKMYNGTHVSIPALEPRKASATADIANAGSRSQQLHMWTSRATRPVRSKRGACGESTVELKSMVRGSQTRASQRLAWNTGAF